MEKSNVAHLERSQEVNIDKVMIKGEQFFKISNCDKMRPFFMSVVSGANHWMFISSNGGLTAGRRNSEFALFPYYTDDKITESAETTGSKTIIRLVDKDRAKLWEPLSIRQEGFYNTSRNLYKNIYGNKLIFEEINHDLKLTFRYQWSSSNKFGFIRSSTLSNDSDNVVDVRVLDGIQNILPAKVEPDLQNGSSNLVDAYKRSELIVANGMGVYALSATIVDRAEPSESLKANIAWSYGADSAQRLVSSMQLQNFRKGEPVENEFDVKAEKGGYFIIDKYSMAPSETKEWNIVADVNKNHADIAALSSILSNTKDIAQSVKEDVEAGTEKLTKLVGAADGLQCTDDAKLDSRHFSNTLFNIMRGGVFPFNYTILKSDFDLYLKKANKEAYQSSQDVLKSLSAEFSLSELKSIIHQSDNPDFKRLCLEYLPLTFSRRHGDPSRPWNRFDINTQNPVDGSIIFDYQGNWRDIFQNWEALGLSFPMYVESMMHKFLNATTFEGYNPYRVTKDGFDWEVSEPDDPWSYIGYWGDHQIIYLLKFLEFLNKYDSEILKNNLDKEIFVFANVPYKIKSYQKIFENPKDTIEFDFELDEEIRKQRAKIGADGALLADAKGGIHRVNFLEKIMVTLMCKLSNLVPEAGIWLNTQRPEWNDANNALVGNGVSMVTVYYLRRFISFFQEFLSNSDKAEVQLSSEMLPYFSALETLFKSYASKDASSFSDTERKEFMDSAGEAAYQYRSKIYKENYSGAKESLSLERIQNFLAFALKGIDHTIRENKREDGLYHAYNLIESDEKGGVAVSYLDEMLEGQVALLSAGYLNAKEVLEVLNSMKSSKLFRPDQYSYILYPNKELPKFLEKNNIPSLDVKASKLLSKLIEDKNPDVVLKDVNGDIHFNGEFKNADDLKVALDSLSDSDYKNLIEEDRDAVMKLFEKIFQHKKFTGRSGTFFGYEGLGSIYWHMVSKLLLAVQECSLSAIRSEADEQLIGGLLDHFYEIHAGIGVHKPPTLYGAFPTDPYSHTPAGRGAQQPGMTGQVKEDILSRFGELGVFIEDACIQFKPSLLRKAEFLSEKKEYHYWSLDGEYRSMDLESGSLAFTFCQVPIIYTIGEESKLTVSTEQETNEQSSLTLDKEISKSIFEREGKVKSISVVLDNALLK